MVGSEYSSDFSKSYKTKPCPKMKHGKCPSGMNCQYAHDLDEIPIKNLKAVDVANFKDGKRLFLVQETPEDYAKISRDYILQEKSDIKWVQDVLTGKKESHRIVHADHDFVLIPPEKIERIDPKKLYLLAIPCREGIQTVRELDRTHIPLLERIKSKSSKVIKEMFDISPNQLDFFFHYHPSTYHLHIHIRLTEAANNFKTNIHLDEALKNLRKDTRFYQKATLPFIKEESDPLLIKFRKAGKRLEGFYF